MPAGVFVFFSTEVVIADSDVSTAYCHATDAAGPLRSIKGDDADFLSETIRSRVEWLPMIR